MAMRWMMALGIGLLAAVAAGQDDTAFENQKERQSYAFGVDVGNNSGSN